MHLKRGFQMLVGVSIVVFLLMRYQYENGSRALIDFIIPYGPLQWMVIIVLVIGAARLIGGKSKDYAPYFYHMLARLSRRPARKAP